MALQAEETHANADDVPLHRQDRLFHAVLAQFYYTGAQVAIAGYFINYATETRSKTNSALGTKFLSGAQASFAIGRFVGTVLLKSIRSRIVLGLFLTMCIVFIGAPHAARKHGSQYAFLTLFFESICFPTILALGMRGLGRHTKRGSGRIVGTVMGGACVPPPTGMAADAYGTGKAMVVSLMFFVAAWSYPLAANFVSRYREVVDAFAVTETGLKGRRGAGDGEGKGTIGKPAAVDMEMAASGGETR